MSEDAALPPPVTPDAGASAAPADAAEAVASEARDQANAVAGTAKEEAQHTGGVAADTIRETAGEARDQVRALYDQTVAVVSKQAAQQQRSFAEALGSLASELTDLSEGRPAGGPGTALVRDASRYARQAADWLDARGPDEVLSEVARYARRHPGQFLAIAAGLGVVAGRFLRSVKDVDQDAAPRRSVTSRAPRSGSLASPELLPDDGGNGADRKPVTTGPGPVRTDLR